MVKHFTFSLSITFISWIIAMMISAFLTKSAFYNKHLTHLNFIKNSRLNKLLGIGVIKWIVKNTFFKFFNPKLKMAKKVELTELDNLRREMTLAEINHLIAFTAVAVFVLYLIFTGKYSAALIMMVVNVLMNLYPSLLQQENKRRLDKLKRICYGNRYGGIPAEVESTKMS